MTSRTFRSTFALKLGHNLLIAGLLATVGVVGVATQETTYAARPDVTTSTTALMTAHDCWTGDAPADMTGKFPGHVVVTVKGETRYAGERMVGKALEQIFDGKDYGLTVAGFCR